jgi:hypothetical protein
MASRATVLSMAEAPRPEFTPRQVDFAKDLVGIGLTHLTIIGLVVGEDVAKLNHAQVSAGHRLIAHCRKELGYGVMDARRANSPFTAAAVKAASKNHRVQVRIA